MTNVYFYPDAYSEEDDLFEVTGKPKYAHYIEVDEIEKFLIDYLCVLNKFPVYLTLTTYNDYEEIEVLLIKLKQEYLVETLSDIVYSSTEDGGILKYHIPIIKVNITNAKALESIISSTFWLAESNCKYIFSTSDNVSYKTEKEKDWRGKDVEYSTIFIDMTKETTTIGITHDAHGLYLFSTLEEYGSIFNIEKQLKNYTIVTNE
ncbi:hypothetical protein [Mesobacillus subterraneus]|uniref:Uncharacterized protein n=1 Tax=Mesobacillus subterraneus TaxID=285983 RepID=A0A0D6Z664_9BACI|nr:hypothetical protein [Mesobacillus subterraneus]KIY20551.1 hypothetical protein UB32_18550 [Mesobacillus subterraneus]